MRRVCGLLLFAVIGKAFVLDNEIVGDPTVDCEDTMVALSFKTKKPFTGRVYVQGLSDDDRCSRNFASNVDQSKFSMMIQNGDCTMQRQRVTGSLEGIMFSLTIVVSFHGTFVTKVDRAYRCMCFFRNIRRLTSGIDIAPIGTTEIIDTAAMPSCSYSIHTGTPDGPPVVFGQVGDKIYHVWECDDSSQGFLVHSCYVNDGRGYRFDLLDIDGCSIDPIIQPDVQYNEDLTRAVVETFGYKFSDTNVLNYECVVELCKKATGECEGLTPPQCGRSRRSVRKVATEKEERQKIDVLASINMLDSIEQSELSDEPNLLFTHPLTQKLIPSQSAVCLSQPALVAFVGVGLSLIISSIVTAIIYARRNSFSHKY